MQIITTFLKIVNYCFSLAAIIIQKCLNYSFVLLSGHYLMTHPHTLDVLIYTLIIL